VDKLVQIFYIIISALYLSKSHYLPRSWVENLGVNHVEFWKAIDRANLKYRKWAAEQGLIKAFLDVDVLKSFKEMGLKMVAVSNASQDCAEFVLKLFDLKKYFDVVLGKDYKYLDGAKPNPYLIKKSLKALEVSPKEALVVGDSLSDILAAHRARTKVVQVSLYHLFVCFKIYTDSKIFYLPFSPLLKPFPTIIALIIHEGLINVKD